MKITDLKLTQDGLRIQDLSEMVEFVKSGGLYTKDVLNQYNKTSDSNLIIINRFEDGQLYLHDGHHRVASIYFAGNRNFLFETEVEYWDYSYSRYMNPNFSNGWYTPFDPRTHVRVPDFFNFKEKVRIMSEQNPDMAKEYILNNQDQYLVLRTEKHNDISGILNIVENGFLLSRNNFALMGECICYYCKSTFSHFEIKQWVENHTGLCPNCGIDSVLLKKYVESNEILESLHQRWFSKV